MTYIYGGHHNTTSRENLNQMFSGEALQGLSNRGMTNTNAIGNPNKNAKIADTPTIIRVSINPVSNNSSITNYLHMQNLMTQALG